jgi:ParB-like chromosome segregation protein Spo0J
VKVANQSFEQVDPKTLQPHPDNPQEGDRQAIAESIEENGFFGYVIVQKSTNRVIAGWHRCAEAIKAGLTEIPAMVLDVDDEAATRILLADNRTQSRMKGSTRNERLIENLKRIQDAKGHIRGTGYSPEQLSKLRTELEPPPPPEDDSEEGPSQASGTQRPKVGVSVASLRGYVNGADFEAWITKLKIESGFDRNQMVKAVQALMGLGG